MLERGQVDEALGVLRKILGRRKPPERGVDRRSESIVLVRANIEKAVAELEHGDSVHAVITLRRAIKSEPG
jgi:hypothetical protein